MKAVIVFDTVEKRGRIIDSSDITPRFILASSMSTRQRNIILNALVPVSASLAIFINEETSNSIKRFRELYTAVSHGMVACSIGNVELLLKMLLDLQTEMESYQLLLRLETPTNGPLDLLPRRQ